MQNYNVADIADLYADTSACLSAIMLTLEAKGLATRADIGQAAAGHLARLEQTEPHPYILLRELAALGHDSTSG